MFGRMFGRPPIRRGPPERNPTNAARGRQLRRRCCGRLDKARHPHRLRLDAPEPHGHGAAEPRQHSHGNFRRVRSLLGLSLTLLLPSHAPPIPPPQKLPGSSANRGTCPRGNQRFHRGSIVRHFHGFQFEPLSEQRPSMGCREAQECHGQIRLGAPCQRDSVSSKAAA